MSKASAPTAPYMLPADHRLRRVQKVALLAGIGATILSIVGAVSSHEQFFRSYLVAFLFWLGPALGSLGILMLQHITGGRWGVSVRRVLEASTRTLPLMALLFVPIVLGMHDLYEWTHAEVVAHDPILQHKSIYLNAPFFLSRAAVYFVIWVVVALLLSRWSLEQDAGATESVGRRLQFLSRGGLLLYAMTMTFAAIDWAMSLTPHWYSHIYGVIIIGGQILTAMAFAIAVTASLVEIEPVSEYVTADRFHDLGKLLLAFIMLWAYFALSQYLIIWSGDLPEETPWYAARLEGGWQVIGIALILFHFVLPFVVLLSRNVKRNPRALAVVTLVFLFIRFLDLYWLVVPAFHPGVLVVHWLDVLTTVAIGGLWIAAFVWQLEARPLLPVGDPDFLTELEER